MILSHYFNIPFDKTGAAGLYAAKAVGAGVSKD